MTSCLATEDGLSEGEIVDEEEIKKDPQTTNQNEPSDPVANQKAGGQIGEDSLDDGVMSVPLQDEIVIDAGINGHMSLTPPRGEKWGAQPTRGHRKKGDTRHRPQSPSLDEAFVMTLEEQATCEGLFVLPTEDSLEGNQGSVSSEGGRGGTLGHPQPPPKKTEPLPQPPEPEPSPPPEGIFCRIDVGSSLSATTSIEGFIVDEVAESDTTSSTTSASSDESTTSGHRQEWPGNKRRRRHTSSRDHKQEPVKTVPSESHRSQRRTGKNHSAARRSSSSPEVAKNRAGESRREAPTKSPPESGGRKRPRETDKHAGYKRARDCEKEPPARKPSSGQRWQVKGSNSKNVETNHRLEHAKERRKSREKSSDRRRNSRSHHSPEKSRRRSRSREKSPSKKSLPKAPGTSKSERAPAAIKEKGGQETKKKTGQVVEMSASESKSTADVLPASSKVSNTKAEAISRKGQSANSKEQLQTTRQIRYRLIRSRSLPAKFDEKVDQAVQIVTINLPVSKLKPAVEKQPRAIPKTYQESADKKEANLAKLEEKPRQISTKTRSQKSSANERRGWSKSSSEEREKIKRRRRESRDSSSRKRSDREENKRRKREHSRDRREPHYVTERPAYVPSFVPKPYRIRR